ncbi:hypothetical protein IFR05_015305 [Cadophora sp. M221]|nr:hypothetical protein IFR05_015305 [Cadophora sp. M221]
MAIPTQLFQPLLPFSLPATIITPLGGIHKSKSKLNQYKDLEKQPLCLVLVFWDLDLMVDILDHDPIRMEFDLHTNSRYFLDPSWEDEVDDKYKAAHYREVRE